ncbi:MAG: ATP-binding protein [Candidatus Riflebacteria bacterium]|nr:ATP-binding protein [Candidatus Riflebacteria bacterium]
METTAFKNPFRPGAGHMPPYLAGRDEEIQEFGKLLDQTVILSNMVLTGLRGVGKTVLLDTFRPMAINNGWLWVGTDLSEAASLNEENIAIRLLTDLSVITSSIVIKSSIKKEIGFVSKEKLVQERLTFQVLHEIYQSTPGLVIDKLKKILEVTWACFKGSRLKGIVFGYDEAQNLCDHAEKNQYPLSLLLDTFQSIQKKNIPFLLVLTGLPTLFPKLVEARTFAERMFRVVFLDRLNSSDSKAAILKPIQKDGCPICFDDTSIDTIVDISGGYPYFIQFICREVFDIFIQKFAKNEKPLVPVESIIRKLDSDFFAGRYSRATDRQRELLSIISMLKTSDSEFTVQEIVDLSKEKLQKPFGSSHVNQMLTSLSESGLVYKNRHGKYSFSVPLLGRFIRRQLQS